MDALFGYRIAETDDSLLGKLIVWGEDRGHAIARLKRALGELEIGGLKTTKPLHIALADDPSVGAGQFHTGWLEPWLESHTAKLV